MQAKIVHCKHLFLRGVYFYSRWMGGTECSPATPSAEGVPHGGMGGARTDGGHSVTGPILKKYSYNGKRDAS